MVIVMAGGGTGGHVVPALAVAERLRERGHRCIFIGTRSGAEARLVAERGFEIEWIEIGGVNRVGMVQKLRAMRQLPLAVWRSRQVMRRTGAAAVFSMGGYVAAPPVVAGITLGLPLITMEPNAVAGMVSRLTSKWVSRALISFEETSKHFPAGRSETTGLPVRREFFELEGRSQGAGFHVLVTGGSRGARSLNRAAMESWPHLLSSGRVNSMTLQCGAAEEEQFRAAAAASGFDVRVQAFLNDMPAEYSRASVVVSRAGAGATAELAAARKPSILVPFPYAADDHQHHNAAAMAKAGAAVMIEDADLSGVRLAEELIRLAEQPEQLRSMSEAAGGLARPEAAQRAADAVELCAGAIDRAGKPPEQ